MASGNPERVNIRLKAVKAKKMLPGRLPGKPERETEMKNSEADSSRSVAIGGAFRFMKYGLIAACVSLPSLAAGQQNVREVPASTHATDEWVQIEAMPVRINGRLYAPTCSQAPGANPAYSYWFHKGTTDGLVVFFNGGGACWNDATCSKPRLAGDRAVFSGNDAENAESVYKAELLPGEGPARMGGIFDRGNPRNPVRDWSMLFVPYCTGDVHSGSNTAHYRYPDTGKPFTIQHRGWDNMQVILRWMRANVSEPAHLLVSGSSAGAYGAATHYAALRSLYPRARSVFLGDSGQGVSTLEFEKTRNINWNYRLPASVFGRKPQLTPDNEAVARLAAHFPRDRFAQFTTAHDATQRAFLAQMGGARTCEAWTNRMTGELLRRQAVSNFRSYLAAGKTHTILRSPLFYAEQTGGAPFAEWLDALLNKDLPENKSCDHCMETQQQCPQ